MAQLKHDLALAKEESMQKSEEIARLEKENLELRKVCVSGSSGNLPPSIQSDEGSEKPERFRQKLSEVQSKETNFVENLVYFIDSLVNSSENGNSSEPDSNPINTNNNEESWIEETHKLISLYK